MQKPTSIWIFACVVFCIFSLYAPAVYGRSIHIEWGYTPPTEPAVTGFRLYQEGTGVCDFPGATTSSGDCDVNLVATITNFTLTATFSDGTESPHSAPFAFNSESGTGDIGGGSCDGDLALRVITWGHWLRFDKPSHKKIRYGGTGKTGARFR